jgi:hypothetical protein
MEDFETIFPAGSKVMCESEMYPGKWEYGVVVAHLETRYSLTWAIRVKFESDDPRLDGALVDYDYRFLDSDPHNSLVRIVK